MKTETWDDALGLYTRQAKAEHVFMDFAERNHYEMYGNSVRMLDNDQVIQLKGLEFVGPGFDRNGDPLERVVLCWQSQCVICGVRYAFKTKSPISYLTRTCEEHRGARKELVAERPAANGQRRYGKHERHVLEVIEDEFGGDDSAPLDMFIRWCAAAMVKPQGRRDHRRFEVSRAVQSLAHGDGAPVKIEGDRIVFNR